MDARYVLPVHEQCTYVLAVYRTLLSVTVYCSVKRGDATK